MSEIQPVAYRYTLHMEFEQTIVKFSEDADAEPFGKPDRDYSAIYPVIREELFTAAQMRQAERDALERAIAIITEPMGMECCGHPVDDHGYVCCGNGEPEFRTIDESVTAIRALLTPPDGEKG